MSPQTLFRNEGCVLQEDGGPCHGRGHRLRKPTYGRLRLIGTAIGVSLSSQLPSAEFLGESDEKPFRPADVAEPIRVFILDYVAYELRAALAEPFKRLVDVVHGEHDAEVA